MVGGGCHCNISIRFGIWWNEFFEDSPLLTVRSWVDEAGMEIGQEVADFCRDPGKSQWDLIWGIGNGERWLNKVCLISIEVKIKESIEDDTSSEAGLLDFAFRELRHYGSLPSQSRCSFYMRESCFSMPGVPLAKWVDLDCSGTPSLGVSASKSSVGHCYSESRG